MKVKRVPLGDLEVEGEEHLAHIGIYALLRAWLVDHEVGFGLIEGALAPEDDARLLNLAFWQPTDAGVAEVLSEPYLAADQLAHNAWHQALAHHLGEAARSSRGLLFVEAVASAFDIYLVGRLLGHHPDADMLVTQVPAMRDAAEGAGFEGPAFEKLLERAHEAPEDAFEALRSVLFDAACALFAAPDPDGAAAALNTVATRPYAPLLHHYELPTWLLYARAYGEPGVDESAVDDLDRALREATDPVALLEATLRGEPAS